MRIFLKANDHYLHMYKKFGSLKLMTIISPRGQSHGARPGACSNGHCMQESRGSTSAGVQPSDEARTGQRLKHR
jgi:hypothetical protein